MQTYTCFVCLEELIKTDKINCSSCKCKGTIGHIHDSCLEIYMNKRDDGGLKCQTCKSYYNFSRNLTVNRLIRSNPDPNYIVKDPLNREITPEDISQSKKFLKSYYDKIYIISIINIIIGSYLLSFKNFYFRMIGILFLTSIIWTLFTNIITDIGIFIQILLLKIVDIFTHRSIDYLDITSLISFVTIAMINLLILYLIVTLIKI